MGLYVAGIIVGLFALDLAARLVFVPLITRILEKVPAFGVQLASPIDGVESFTVHTADDVEVSCSLFRPVGATPKAIVIFCPELSGNRWMAPRYCEGLLKNGYAVVAFDFRNQGDSQAVGGYRPIHWVTEFELKDLTAVRRALSSRAELSGLPVGLFGVSRGGSAALTAAARDSSIAAVACDSAFAIESMMEHYTRRWASLYVPPHLLRLIPWRHTLRTLALTRRISQFRRKVKYVLVDRETKQLSGRAVLLIAGDRDTYIPVQLAQKMVDSIGDSASLWIAPGAKHNMARSVCQDEYDQQLVAFFDEACSVTGSTSGTASKTTPAIVASSAK